MMEERTRVLHVITRWIRGGAREIVARLLERLPFRQALAVGLGEPNASVPTFVIPSLVREVDPKRDLRALFHLHRAIRKWRPHVVHAHTYKAGILGCLAARAARVRAIVFTPHGHIFAPDAEIPGVPRGSRLELLRWITRAGQMCADRITALSPLDLDQQLRLRLARRSKYCVIRNGIDPGLFSEAGERRNGSHPLLGSVGRLSREKGQEILLDAFRILRRTLPGAGLVLAGAGDRETELRSRAGEGVRFVGEVESRDFLRALDIYVHPSHYESQGMAILEAMAAGLPVVATDVGGVADVVEDGVTGILVPPRSPQAIADAVLRLVREPERARRLAENARIRVRERFSLEAMVDAYASLYRSLLYGESETRNSKSEIS